MRMRKKKNCDARMERCSDIWIKDLLAIRAMGRTLR